MRGEHPGAMLLPREVFDQIGPFREDHGAGTFVEWYARALDSGRSMSMVDSVVMRRRLHETNMGRVSTPGMFVGDGLQRVAELIESHVQELAGEPAYTAPVGSDAVGGSYGGGRMRGR